MGQFLAVGLAIRLSVSKKKMAQAKVGQDELVSEMEKQLHFRSALYTLREEEERCVLRIKDEILRSELIPFLETLYPLLYHLDEYTDFSGVLTALRATDPKHWLALAEEKRYGAFQSDPYGMPAYLRGISDRLPVSCSSILLSMEGKILMEEYGRQFNFLQYCIARTFPAFALAGSVRVYITG